ncbi:centrosomal protein of 120 kDa-like [Schistocerca piceifrons]|uniref:centrosomal protein of 120 kDa-like n=1 Tax=Schistocerca piceifrons TaxID=274613 RepID=UPI001F5FC1D4|nr:centrosomal protein of 120 kDa-like [Schistocerca piceifrons]
MESSVILRIRKGSGFGFLEEPILIRASLAGTVHETELCQPSEEPILDVELHWDTEKKVVKRLRTLRTQLRLECLTQSLKRIGYFLVPLTTAWIIKHGEDVKVEDKWYKLIDAGFCKPHKPELLISLRIEERERIQVDTEISQSETNIESCESLLQESGSQTSFNSEYTCQNSQLYFPELCEAEGFIQIGPQEETRDIFLFTVFIGDSGHLSSLVTDTEDQNSAEMHFSFNVLGVTVRTNPLVNISEPVVTMKERSVFRIRSSLKILQNYFLSKPVMKICLMKGEKECASSDVDLSALIPADRILEFNNESFSKCVKRKKHCILCTSATEVPQEVAHEPFVDILVKLKYLGTGREVLLLNTEDTELARTPRKKLPVETLELKDVATSVNIPDLSLMEKIAEINDDCITPTPGTLNTAVGPGSFCWSVKTSDNVEPYHIYCLQIELQEIIFYKYPPQENFFFIFNHSKAQILTTALDEICVHEVNKYIHLQGFGCKMHFEAPVQEIDKQLLTEPPTISIYNKINGENIKFAEAQLDVALLFLNREKLSTSSALISALNKGEIVGILTVSVTLKDYGLQLPMDVKAKYTSLEQGMSPLVCNNQLTSKAVKELEEWKAKQKEIFREQLQRKENYYLSVLSANWELKKEELEKAINSNIQKFSALAQSLEVSATELYGQCTRAREEEIQLQELKEMYRKTQDELKIERTSHELARQEWEKEKATLKQKNQSLEEELNKLKDTILIFNPSGETSNIVAELKEMEAKYQDALRAKKFFKEELALLLHEHREEIQSQMKHNKEELKALGLEQLLHREMQDLQKDQDLIAAAPRLSIPVHQKSPTTFISCHEDVQRDASRLIEEMDTLLSTGNYTEDDPVILGLKNEIRNLQL